MQKLFVANWKMHGDLAMLESWAARFCPPPDCRIVVCPPLPYLAAARQLLPPSIAVGAQQVSRHAQDGAHTGEVSARMLLDAGCAFVIVGHSERRAAGQTDDECAAQFAAAVAAGLSPILCVGESEAEYAAGDAEAVVARQLRAVQLPPPAENPPPCAVAYEPVWAIGSGKTPSPEALSQKCERIRRQLFAQTGAFGGTIRVLYGGSIKTDNASLLGRAGMDGGLVGGASLDAAGFSQICRAGGA